MSISPVCVDASVVVKLVASHEDTVIQDLWERWSRDGCQIVAPALLFYEVPNAVYHAVKYGTVSEMAAVDALQAALSLPIQVHTQPDLHQRALLIAQRFGLPATYDAHYLALAELYGAEMWTADRRLVDRCQQDWVKLIE